MISAVVLTKNSESTIKSCLHSLAFADERIVIDDHSDDKTIVLAKRLGAQVYQRDLAGDFSRQHNFGLQKARHEWVLFVDSDERVSKESAAEIKSLVTGHWSQVYDGFYFKRQDTFLGKRLEHGETAAVSLLRLARKQAGQWQGKVHEVWHVEGKTASLKYPLLHPRPISLSRLIERLSWYARLRAQELYGKKVQESWFKLLVNPLGKFGHNYFWRLGFLDGFPGLAMAWLMSWHSLLVRIWLRLLWRNHGKDTFIPNPNTWR